MCKNFFVPIEDISFLDFIKTKPVIDPKGEEFKIFHPRMLDCVVSLSIGNSLVIDGVRSCGKSSLLVLYSLWALINGKNVIYFSHNNISTIMLHGLFRDFVFYNLDQTIYKFVYQEKHTIITDRNNSLSFLAAMPSSLDRFRGRSTDVIIIDNASWIENVTMTYFMNYCAFNSSQVIISSTNKPGSFFNNEVRKVLLNDEPSYFNNYDLIQVDVLEDYDDYSRRLSGVIDKSEFEVVTI